MSRNLRQPTPEQQTTTPSPATEVRGSTDLSSFGAENASTFQGTIGNEAVGELGGLAMSAASGTGTDALASLDPGLAQKVEGTLDTAAKAAKALSGASILELRPDGDAAAELHGAERLEDHLISAILALDAEDDVTVGAGLDRVADLADRLQVAAELVEAERELYTLLGTAGVFALLGPMAAAESMATLHVEAGNQLMNAIVAEMEGCVATIEGVFLGLTDIAMREQLKQLLSQIGTATADMLGVRNIFGTLASALVSFSGARLMEDTLDGKTSFTKGGALTLGKTVTDMVLKSDFFVGMPKDAGQIASAVGTVISLDGVMDKLAVEAPPAVEAIGRLEVLGRRLLTGDVAPRVAATRSQLWLLQRTVEPLVEAIASSAVDADHWQNIIGDLRSVYGPALFAETA